MRFYFFAIALFFSMFSAGASPAKERVKIGYVGGFSGSDPNTAKELWRGLNIGLESNPRLRERVDLIKYDDHGDPAEAAKIVTRAMQEGVKILFGFPSSDEALAAAKVLGGREALMIAPFATNPSVSKQGDNILQICFSDDFQGAVLARFTVQDLKPKKILTLTNIESVYSSGLSSAYRETLAKSDSKIKMADFRYSSHDLKLPELEAAVKREAPEVIFVPDHIIRASVLIKKAHEVDPHIRFVGGDGLGGKGVFLNVFSGVKDIDLYYSGHWDDKIQLDENRVFVDHYNKAYPGSDPTSGAALTWDGAKMILKAIDATKRDDDPKALLTWIRKNSFQTTTGVLTLKKPGRLPAKPAVLIGFKKGSYGYIRQIK